MAKSKFKKAIPIIILLLIVAFLGFSFFDGKKKAKDANAWLDALRSWKKYFDPTTREFSGFPASKTWGYKNIVRTINENPTLSFDEVIKEWVKWERDTSDWNAKPFIR